MVIYHPSKIIFYDPQVDSSIKTSFNIIGNHIWKLLTCRRSCYPPWSPGRLGLWETPRRCFAGALNIDSCNSYLPCNTEKGLRKRKIFSLKRTLYNLFFMKYFCLTMGFKCFPWKPQTHLIPLTQSTCQVTSEPDASPVSHCQDCDVIFGFR